MKKILFCSASIKTGAGGIASYAQDFIDTFKNEYEFTVITDDDGSVDDELVKVNRIDANDWSAPNVERLLEIIKRERPNIIVNSSFSLLSIATPFIPDDIKIITVSHFTNGLLAKQAGLNGDYVDAIIGLSSFAKRYLEQYSKVKDKEKVKVVYNFMREKESTDLSLKQNANVLNIVYPGGSIYQKSADVVCKSILKLLKTDLNFNLFWIGNVGIVGGNLPLSKTSSLKDILPSDSRIKKLGSVPREESQHILANANIFLLPSRGEGFPISLIEAMRGCSIPVISDAKHGALDLIKDGVNGFVVKQGDSDDLYERLVFIIKNHSSLANLYRESYNTFQEFLTKNVWKEKMYAILETENNHKKRGSVNEYSCLLRCGKKKMKTAERQFRLFDRLIKQPYMMIKYRYIRYIYRIIVKP